MKRLYFTILVAMATLLAHAAAPNSSGTYYQNADGKKGAALKTAMCGIIYNRSEQTYKSLWTAFHTTDVRSDGKIWDMYSDNTNYVPGGSAQGANYSSEGDSYNREHSFPQSWFGSNAPMYTDLHHIYPTDGFVNSKRSNYPFGETNGTGQGSYQSNNGFSKLGTCTYSGYTGKVFEPADEYKGDFARTYFYMVTCYEEKLHDWVTNYASTEVTEVLDGNKYPGFTSWQLYMLLAWAAADPVSDKETARNNAVFGIQGNRNPFIDYPGLEQYIWGDLTTTAFSYNNYVVPEGYSSGSGSGGGTGGGSGTTIEAGTYKLTITPSDFNSSSYAANNNEKTSTAVCTTDATKTCEVKWTSNQVMLQSSNMQWQKSAGYIYNSTDLGTITGVTITSSAGTYTTYYGTSEQPSSSTTVGNGFFRICVGGATGTTSKVEITFTIDAPALQDPVTYSTPTSTSYNGDSFTLVNGTHFTTDGTVTLSSSNPSVASVDGLTVIPHVVGECFISVTYGQGSTYKASNSVFKFTVTAPDGKTTAKPSESGLLFGETFGNNSSNARAWSDNYSVKSGVNSVYSGITGYTVTNAKQSINTGGSTASGLIQTTQGTDASIIIGPLNVVDYSNLTLTYQWKAGSIKGTYTTNLYYATSSTGTYNAISGSGNGSTTFVERSYSLPAAAQVNTLYLKIVWNTSNTGAVIDEVQLTGAGNSAVSVKLNSSGYATYCSEYPLDFSNATDFTAWQVTGISGTAITFSQVTGAVKGGTGLLLMGEPNATVTLSSVGSSVVLSSNLLEGTLAPTYVESETYYGLSGSSFVKVNAGTVPKGKALLPASVVDGNSEVKALTFVFEGSPTSVSSLEKEGSVKEERIFNLAGQRLSRPQRGVNIINGKKVIVK